MKKSSRDRRVFRRLQRRSMLSQLLNNQLNNAMTDMAYLFPLSGLYLDEIQETIRIINTTAIDTSKIQEAFHKVNEAFNNLSKINTNANPIHHRRTTQKHK